MTVCVFLGGGYRQRRENYSYLGRQAVRSRKPTVDDESSRILLRECPLRVSSRPVRPHPLIQRRHQPCSLAQNLLASWSCLDSPDYITLELLRLLQGFAFHLLRFLRHSQHRLRRDHHPHGTIKKGQAKAGRLFHYRSEYVGLLDGHRPWIWCSRLTRSRGGYERA